MMKLLQAFRSGAGTIKSRLAEVRENIERLRQRREELRVAPLPVQERVDLLAAVLERRAASYGEATFRRMQSLIGGDPMTQADSPGLSVSMILLQGMGQPSGQEIEGLIAYLFPDRVREALTRVCSQNPAKAGPPRAEREAELERIERMLAQLESEQREIVAEFEAIKQETLV